LGEKIVDENQTERAMDVKLPDERSGLPGKDGVKGSEPVNEPKGELVADSGRFSLALTLSIV
jgi:hypothetical protein